MNKWKSVMLEQPSLNSQAEKYAIALLNSLYINYELHV